MRDAKITLPRLQLLHPAIKDEVIAAFEHIEANLLPKNICIRAVQTLRTFEEQNKIFNTRPQVSKARGGQSYHNYGLAFDFALMYDLDGNGTFEALSWDTKKDGDKDGKADWMEVVAYFKSLGYVWGGDFRSIPDSPHMEKTMGHGWRDLLNKYNAKKFIQGTNYVAL